MPSMSMSMSASPQRPDALATRAGQQSPDPRMQDIAVEVLRGFRAQRSMLAQGDDGTRTGHALHALCAAEARIVESNFDYFDETFPVD